MRTFTTEKEYPHIPKFAAIIYLVMLLIGGTLNAANCQDIELGVYSTASIDLYFDYTDIGAVSAAHLQADWDSTHFEFVDVELAPQWDSIGFLVIENVNSIGSGRYQVAMAHSDTLQGDTLMLTINLKAISGNFSEGSINFQGRFNEDDSVFVQSVSYVIDETLPVSLTRFHATISSNHVSVRWNTSSETNNALFEVYAIEYNWGLDGRWMPGLRHYLGSVSGAGTTNEPKGYRITGILTAGTYRFMLKQIDFDGEFELHWSDYYEVLMNESSLNVYPIPANPGVTISYVSPNMNHVKVKIFDVLGREVLTVYDNHILGRMEWYQDMSRLGSGTFFVVASSTNGRVTRKITVVK